MRRPAVIKVAPSLVEQDLAECPHCTRQPKLLSYMKLGSEINYVLTAHDCDGIGVLERWEQHEGHWILQHWHTEQPAAVVDKDPVPQESPLKAQDENS